MPEEKKKEYKFEKDIKSGTIDEPDNAGYDATYRTKKEFEDSKKLEVCDLAPDEEGICEKPEEKKKK